MESSGEDNVETEVGLGGTVNIGVAPETNGDKSLRESEDSDLAYL